MVKPQLLMDPEDNFLNIYSVRSNILLALLVSDIFQNGGHQAEIFQWQGSGRVN